MKQQKIKQIPGPKVTAEVEARLQMLAQKTGCKSLYQLLCYVVNALIMYMDKDNQLDTELQEVIDIFERFDGWGQAVTLTDVGQRWKAVEAIYFVVDENKTGMMACWAKKPFFDQMKVSFNKVDILDAIIRRLFPDLDKDLGILCVQMSKGSKYEVLRECVSSQITPEVTNTLREMFSDCGRHEFGRDTNLMKYIRHNSKRLENFENGPIQLKLFEQDEQGQELPASDLLDSMEEAGCDDEEDEGL